MNRLIMTLLALCLIAGFAGTASAYGYCGSPASFGFYPTKLSAGYTAPVPSYYYPVNNSVDAGCAFGQCSYGRPAYRPVLFPRLRRFFGNLLPPYSRGF